MSTMSPDAARRLEAARRSDGRFGHQRREEAQIQIPAPRPAGRRRASRGVALGATFALAFAMTGCSADSSDFVESQHDYVEICQESQSLNRVDDDKCEEGSSSGNHAHFFYIPTAGGRTVPAVGSRVDPSLGSTQKPSGSITRVAPSGGSFAKAGTVTRGGFGSTGGGAGS